MSNEITRPVLNVDYWSNLDHILRLAWTTDVISIGVAEIGVVKDALGDQTEIALFHLTAPKQSGLMQQITTQKILVPGRRTPEMEKKPHPIALQYAKKLVMGMMDRQNDDPSDVYLELIENDQTTSRATTTKQLDLLFRHSMHLDGYELVRRFYDHREMQ